MAGMTWRKLIGKRDRFEPYTRHFRGHVLHVHDIASFRLGNNELFQDEIYKFHSSRPSPFIIDCGSNLGMSIIYFKTLYPQARVIGFEADPHIFSFLEKNVRSYELQDVMVLNRAVWNANDEKLSFLVEGGAGGRLQEKTDGQQFVEVQTARLRDYLTGEVDFLKIDIEGAEYRVIADVADKLHLVDTLFIEYHSMPSVDQNLHRILSIVHDAGFRYHIKEAYTTPYPFMERRLNVGMDLQLNIFCYRGQ